MATDFVPIFDAAFRDYNTDNVPASGAFFPIKGEIRLAARAISDRINEVAIGGGIRVTSLANLNAIVAPPPNTPAEIRGSVSNDGYYRKTGAAGVAGWEFAAPFDTALSEQVELLQKYAVKPIDFVSVTTEGTTETLFFSAPEGIENPNQPFNNYLAFIDPATPITLVYNNPQIRIEGGPEGGRALRLPSDDFIPAGTVLKGVIAITVRTRPLSGDPTFYIVNPVAVSVATGGSAASEVKGEEAIVVTRPLVTSIDSDPALVADNRSSFSSALTGPRQKRSPIAAGVVVNSEALGYQALRIRNADISGGQIDVASRRDFRPKPGRLYRVDFEFARHAAPSINAAVECRVQNLNAAYGSVSNARLGAQFTPSAGTTVRASFYLGYDGVDFPDDLPNYTIPATSKVVLPLLRILAGSGGETDVGRIGDPVDVTPVSSAVATDAYRGTWNAATNSPTITSGQGTRGDYYVVATAGSTNIDGVSTWLAGDQIRFNGTAWQRVPQPAFVTSVAGKEGAVSLVVSDVNGAANTDLSNLASPATALATLGGASTAQLDVVASRLGSYDRGAIALIPPAKETEFIQTAAWDSAVDPTRGGATYVKTTLDALLSKIWPKPAPSVLAYLPMHGPANSPVKDLSSYARTVTAVGAPRVDATHKLFGQNMAYFPATANDRYTLPDSPNWVFNTGPFTVDFWAVPDGLPASGTKGVFFAQQSNSTTYHYLGLNPDGSIEYKRLSAGTAVISATSAAGAVSPNVLQHIALGREGNDFNIYVDKKVVATTNDTDNIPDYSDVFRIGSFSTVGSFKGWMGRFRVQNVAMWSTGYDVTASGQVVPAKPRPEYSLVPEQAYQKTPSGQYYVLVPAVPSVDQFGGRPDAVVTLGTGGAVDTVTGYDNAPAFDALHAFMAVYGVPGRISEGDYLCSREIHDDSGQVTSGKGRGRSNVIIRMGSNETGWRIAATGSGVRDLKISIGAYASRGSGRGDLQSCITVGDQKFTNGAPLAVEDYLIENVQFAALNLGFPVSGCMILMHSAFGGTIRRVTDKDSPGKFNIFELSHWGGKGKGDNAGVLLSGHNNASEQTGLRITRSTHGLWLSSSYNFAISNVEMTGVRQALLVFVGDETNFYAPTAEKDRVGRGLSLKRLRVYDVENESTQKLFEVTSVGSSTFRLFPSPDEANGRYKDQLPLGCVVEDVLVVGSPNADKTIVYIFEAIGRIVFRDFEYRNVAGRPMQAASSFGVQFDGFHGESAFAGSGPHFWVQRSSVHARRVDITGPVTADLVGCGVLGGVTSGILDGALAQGATTLLLTAPITEDVVEGQDILVNGYLVKATAFAESNKGNTEGLVGNKRLFITPLPVAVASGATVEMRHLSSADIEIKTRGFDIGVDAQLARYRLHGDGPEGAGLTGYRIRNGAFGDILAPRTKNNGVRQTGTTCDLSVATESRCAVHGGVLGVDGKLTSKNIVVSGAETADGRLVMFGTRIAGNATMTDADVISASSASDYRFFGVAGPSGALFP